MSAQPVPPIQTWFGQEFSARDVTLPGFEVRPGTRNLSPSLLPMQSFEVLRDATSSVPEASPAPPQAETIPSGGALGTLSFTCTPEDVVVGIELSLPRDRLDLPIIRRLLDTFLLHATRPQAASTTTIGSWLTRAIASSAPSEERQLEDRVILVERIDSRHAPLLRVSVQCPEHLARACVHCAGGNPDRFLFCMRCGSPRDIPPPPSAAQDEAPPNGPGGPSDLGLSLARAWGRDTPLPVPNLPRPSLAADAADDEHPVARNDAADATPTARGVHLSTPPRNVYVTVSGLPETRTANTPPSAHPPHDPTLPATGAVSDVETDPSPERHDDTLAIPDHDGSPLNDACLFVPAPPEIGMVRSASSSFRRHTDALSTRLARSLPWVLGWSCAGWIAVEALSWAALAHGSHADAVAALRAPFALLLGSGALGHCLSMRHACSYVGTDGIARAEGTWRISPPATLPMQILRFATSSALYVNITHRPHQISFDYTWRGADGNITLHLGRRCIADRQGLRPERKTDLHLYDFCRAAEQAWTTYCVERAAFTLRQHTPLSFPVLDPKCRELTLGDGFLRCTQENRALLIPIRTLNRVDTRSEQVHFMHGDQGFSLPGSRIGNLSVLLNVLGQHFGVRID